MRTQRVTLRGALLWSALLGIALVCSVGTASAQMKQTEEETSGLRYLMALPPGHDLASPGKWPVLVFLHGSGETGTNLMDITPHSIPAVVESDYWDWPFIVVSPQSEGGGWSGKAAALTAILTRMETELHADPNRFYLTGLSMGGEGTWDLGQQMSGTWAALMPLCGSEIDNFMPATFATTSLFVVHGDADNDNPYQASRDMVDQIIAAGADFFEFDYPMSAQFMDAFPTDVLNSTHVFATLNGYGHDVWDATYGVRDMNPKKTVPYEWLLKQSLNGAPFVDPLDPNQPSAGGAGGMAGTAGAAGTAGGGGAGGAAGAGGTAGAAGGVMGGAGGAGGANAGTGGAPVATAGMPPVAVAGGAAGSAPSAVSASSVDSEGGCSLGQRARGVSLWYLLGVVALWVHRRRNSLRVPSVS